MNPIPWYQSATLRALLVAFVSQLVVWLGLTDKIDDAVRAAAVDGLLQFISFVAMAWAGWARMRLATPPLTNIAAQRRDDRVAAEQPPATPTNAQAGFARAWMLGILLAIAVPSAMIVTGCETIGLTQPKSFDQRLAYAYSTHTAILEATTVAVTNGRLSAADGQAVLGYSAQSRALLDAAKLASVCNQTVPCDASTAEGRLTLALNVLTQLQTYLSSKGVK